MRRVRTTKERARRIDLMYFAHPSRFRRWRFWLSVAVPAIALVWFVASRAQGGQKAYSSGPLSVSHAVFAQQCALCHVQQAGAFFEHATGKACLTCHDAPPHQARQIFTPECSSCHVEHKGAMRLKATADAACTQCHAALRTREGQPKFAAAITGFDRQHPEFAALREGPAGDKQTDPGKVKLNHYVHLQPNLIGPSNTRVQMTCDECHRPAGVDEPWPYADAPGPIVVAVGGTLPGTPNPQVTAVLRGAHMAPPAFARQCAACHTLEFDRRFAHEQVPHDTPQAVHDFLVKRFSEHIAANPASVPEVVLPDRQLPERMRAPRVASNASEWVRFRTEEAEGLLWAKTCKECHTLNPTSGPLPEVAKPNITARWLPHAEFDHNAHRMMKCESCHSGAPESRETSDVLVPGIRICQDCHRAAGPAKDFAEGRCFECHQYHDWKNEKRVKGRYDTPQLRGKLRPPGSQAR